MTSALENRINRSLECAARLGADALFISSTQNARYLSGFTGSNVTLIFSPKKRILLTDQRYGDQAAQETASWDVVVSGQNKDRTVAEILSGFSDQSLAFEDAELTVSQFSILTQTKAPKDWIPLGGELVGLRAVKDDGEIDLIRRSVGIAQTGFSDTIEFMVPGMSEAAIAAEIEYRMGRSGSECPAFPTIVAAGEHSAHPHAHPGANALEKNDLITIDWGAVYGGYHSDLTRVVRMGEVDSQREQLLSLTMEAFDAAMESIKPGVSGDRVDAAARSVFADHGMEARSLRGLGHGVGLEIHERPRIVMGSDEILEPGMVFTIEPGLYLPGVGGVRVEHTVLLTDSGPEVLSTKLPLVIENTRN